MTHRMQAGSGALRRAKTEGEQVTNRREFEWLARGGLLARGVVYGIIGVLAVKLALGDGGKATNQQGALKTIAGEPAGKVLLVLLAIGLFGYAAWRLTRAARGRGIEAGEDDTTERIGGVASGIVYGALFVTAIQILTGSGGSSGHPDKATGGVLDWPAGPWLVGIAGLIMIGVGLEQARRGLTREFAEESKTVEMSEKVRKVFTTAGVFGHLARCVVFALIGYFLIKAAIDYNPHKAVGLDGALAKLGHASGGSLLLGIVAAGLLGFAMYSVLDARYRKV